MGTRRRCPDCHKWIGELYFRRCKACREEHERKVKTEYRTKNIVRIRRAANEWRKNNQDKVVASRKIYLENQKRMKAELLEDMLAHPRKYLNRIKKETFIK